MAAQPRTPCRRTVSGRRRGSTRLRRICASTRPGSSSTPDRCQSHDGCYRRIERLQAPALVAQHVATRGLEGCCCGDVWCAACLRQTHSNVAWRALCVCRCADCSLRRIQQHFSKLLGHGDDGVLSDGRAEAAQPLMHSGRVCRCWRMERLRTASASAGAARSPAKLRRRWLQTLCWPAATEPAATMATTWCLAAEQIP
jgi:hypothetical protein